MARDAQCESCGTDRDVHPTGHIPSSFPGPTPKHLCVGCYQARVNAATVR